MLYIALFCCLSGNRNYKLFITVFNNENCIVLFKADEEMPEDYNPFTIPADNDIFMLRDKERQRKKAVSKR